MRSALNPYNVRQSDESFLEIRTNIRQSAQWFLHENIKIEAQNWKWSSQLQSTLLCLVKIIYFWSLKFPQTHCQKLKIPSVNSSIGVVPKWSKALTEFSEFSKSRESNNHWRMNWAQFKDPVFCTCLPGTVVASGSFLARKGYKLHYLSILNP